jgi:EmrB/QacA subfamily drug resistance transporter
VGDGQQQTDQHTDQEQDRDTDQDTDQDTDRHSEPDPRRWRILSVSLVVGFMALLDVSIVNIALPSMQQGLHASSGGIQWVVSGYALTFGLVLVGGGRLGDAYGRRRLMLIGLAGFVLASAAVGLAPSAAIVILARLVQGLAAGLLTPQNSGLIQQLFQGDELGKAFGLFGLTVSISAACGPVLGGGILALAGQHDGWRYLFLLNVPIGVVALFFVARLIPGRDQAVDRSDPGIDVVGAVLLGLLVVDVLYPVVSAEGRTYWPLVLLVLAPLLGWGFLRWERHRHRSDRPPLLDVSLLSSVRGYASGLTIGTLYFAGLTGTLLAVSVYLQGALGLGPLHAGLLVAPYAVGAAFTGPIGGTLVSSVGRAVTSVSLAVVAVGFAAFAFLVPSQSVGGLWWVALTVLLLAGLGGGAVVSPNMTLSLAEVPPEMGGAAGGALQTGQRIGSSIGAAVLMTAYTLGASDLSPGAGLRIAGLTGALFVVIALAVSVRDWRRGSSRPQGATG